MQLIVGEEERELVNEMLKLDVELRKEQIKAVKESKKAAKMQAEYIPKLFEMLKEIKEKGV